MPQMLSFQAEKGKQKCLFYKSHHANLTIAYKPWVYTSSKWIWEKGLIPKGASKQAMVELIPKLFVLQNVKINRLRGWGGGGGVKHWS